MSENEQPTIEDLGRRIVREELALQREAEENRKRQEVLALYELRLEEGRRLRKQSRYVSVRKPSPILRRDGRRWRLSLQRRGRRRGQD